MRVLGVSAFYHDSAAALVEDGVLVAAAQEERFTRLRHDAGFPARAIEYVLGEAEASADDVDLVVFYDKPFLKFERLLETYVAFAPRGFESFRAAMPVWVREKLFLKRLLRKHLEEIAPGVDWFRRLRFTEHHLSHAASAFYPSPFEEALVLTIDGVGEWATTSVAMGRGTELRILKEIHFPHSLGLLYSAFTYHAGFKVNSGEYKLMGLAPYGVPRYAEAILEEVIDVKPDGSFRLNLDYFDYCTGLRMTNSRFAALLGVPRREPESAITQEVMDLAASVQTVLEEVVLRLTRALAVETGARNLCLGGGVALNCVANARILRDGAFEGLWIQPAAGDAGGAVGAAFAAYYAHTGASRPADGVHDRMSGAYLGPAYSQAEVEQRLRRCGAVFETLDDDALLRACVEALEQGNALGWFQGRMEFGPRALGARSILGDPRSATMQSLLNLKVKQRESFRPFAPSVLAEEVEEWFEFRGASPYMLLVAEVSRGRRIPMTEAEERLFGIDKLNVPRSDIPAVTHVDYSARLQTVHRETNPRYHALIGAFRDRTGCPVLVNTSFNIRGEPIVCTPEDAFRCFMGTEIEAMAVGNAFLRKERQDASLRAADYVGRFSLD